MLAMYFPLMTAKAARISETLYFLTAWQFADIGAIMFVHVFSERGKDLALFLNDVRHVMWERNLRVFTFSLENWPLVATVSMYAGKGAIVVPRYIC